MAKLNLVMPLAILAVSSTISAQFFGGRTNYPGGGFNQQAGFKAGPAWGSLSQDFDRRGFSSPITVGAGAGHTSPNGHGLSGQVLHQPGFGGQGSLNGQIGLINNDRHKLAAFGQHDRFLDRNLKPIGPATNTGGLKYDHAGGTNAFISGSRTQGLPATGTVGANVPLYKNDNTNLQLGGQTTFGHGMKPDHQLQLKLEKTF